MAQNAQPTNVFVAFEMLLEEIEAEVELVNRAGAKAFENGNYDLTRSTLERAGQLTAFRDRADGLRREWEGLFAGAEDEADDEAHAERRNLGRLQRGIRTPEQAYNKPILEVLATMGGSGQMGEVLEAVRKRMKNVLKKVDFEPLASDPNIPRWRNAAQWARNTLVREGLLRNDSPRGTWELTGEGLRATNN
jgi:hypothetical protein